jgi:hypothetical protein
MTHPQKIFSYRIEAEIPKITTLRSKSLILKCFLTLNFRSICSLDRFMRHLRGQKQAYPQSYPQFMWMDG